MNMRHCLMALASILVLCLVPGCDPPIDELPTPVAASTRTPSPALPTQTPLPTPTVQATPTRTVVLKPTRSPPTGEPTSRPAPARTATPFPIPTTPSPTTDTRTRGGTLRLSTSQNIGHLDVHHDVSPALSTWGPGIAYSRLLRLRSGPDLALPSLAVECDLCELWTMESPSTYTFELRSNARWQTIDPVGGRPVSAHDVAYSYVRQSGPELPNSALMHNIDEVIVAGPTTLRITLKNPDADGLLPFADGHSKIVANEAVDLSGDLRDGPTIGSGPWILRRTSQGDAHAFERNTDYYEPDIPLVDELTFLVLEERETRNAAFQTRLIDILDMLPSEWTEYSSRSPGAPFLAVPQPGGGIEVAFNTALPPFDNLELRRAAILGMEPAKAIEEHWYGFAYIGPAFPVASAEWLIPQRELASRFNRKTDAQDFLRASGATAPFPLVITVGDFGEPYVHHAHAIAVELDGLGFAVETEIVNRREFGERVWLGGEYQLMVGPPAPITVPNGYLLPVLHSDGVWNTTGHRDRQLDELLESQAVELDPAARATLIRRIQERVLDQGYRFMPARSEEIWTWRPEVRDFHPNFGAFEYHHWARVWLAD